MNKFIKFIVGFMLTLLLISCARQEMTTKIELIEDWSSKIEIIRFDDEIGKKTLSDGYAFDTVGTKGELVFINSLDTRELNNNTQYFYSKEFIIYNELSSETSIFTNVNDSRAYDFTLLDDELFKVVERLEEEEISGWELLKQIDNQEISVFKSESKYFPQSPPVLLEYESTFIVIEADAEIGENIVYKYNINTGKLEVISNLKYSNLFNNTALSYIIDNELFMILNSEEKSKFLVINLEDSSFNETDFDYTCNRGIIFDGKPFCSEFTTVHNAGSELLKITEEEYLINDIVQDKDAVVWINDRRDISFVNSKGNKLTLKNNEYYNYIVPKIVMSENSIYLLGADGEKGNLLIYKLDKSDVLMK